MSRNSGGCRNCLLASFRVLQFIFSLIALGCGAYITYVMFDMASSARSIDQSIQNLLNPELRQQLEQDMPSNFTYTDSDIQDFALGLNETIVPVLHVLEGTPIRAIIISSVALWSTVLIIYLFFAHRSANKRYDSTSYATLPNTPSLSPYAPLQAKQRNLRRNSRRLRISLSLLTLLAWIVALVCGIMLMLEYSITMVTGGAEAKISFTALKPIIERALKDVVEGGDDHKILRALDVVNDILTIGAMAILTVISILYCTIAELASVFVACCVSGKAKKNKRSDAEKTAAITSPNNGSEVNQSLTYGFSPWTGPDTPSSVSVSTPMSYQYGHGTGYLGPKTPYTSVTL